ncbi:hypothetical protein FJM67_11460 [Maribrevibacterium harenarium]|uniref:Lipoprotein n=1 Tax=Maribrevibacterium harenarium TaxID=2589817 RepID=A0A501WLX5_9GAMM|nr:hypothetical protein [Maribrevibacterium harenarium]TPE49822.1 hypothetical protein FJM67_11460 [Maribrevibacterium harenarium]
MKAMVLIGLSLVLAACASGPSEEDIARMKAEQAQAAEVQRQRELDAQFENIQQQAKQASQKVSN